MVSFSLMETRVFLLLLEICIVVSSVLRGSAGYDRARSPAKFPSGPPEAEIAPGFGYHEKSLGRSKPSPPPLKDGYVRARSPANSPARPPENERKPGFAYPEKSPRASKSSPSPLRDGPAVHSSMESAPVSEVSHGPIKSMQSIPPTVSPPRNVANSAPVSEATPGPVKSMPSIPPTVSPPRFVANSAPVSEASQGPVKSMPLIPPTVSPPLDVATPPKTSQGLSPHMLPSISHSRAPNISPISMPLLPEPAVIPISAPPPSSSGKHRIPVAAPGKETSNHKVPMNHSQSIGASPLASPAPQTATTPGYATAPSKSFSKPLPRKWFQSPASSPPRKETSNHKVPMNHSKSIGASILASPAPQTATMPGYATAPSKSFPKPLPRKWFRSPASSPPRKETSNHKVPMNHSKSASPLASPAPQGASKPGRYATAPSKSIPKPLLWKWFHSPAYSPSSSFNEHNYSSEIASSPAPAPPYPLHPPTSVQQAPSQPPTIVPRKSRQRHHSLYIKQGPSASPSSPFPSTGSPVSPVASPSSAVPSGKRPVISPTISPFGSYTKKTKAPTPLPAQVLVLPPPPPNRDCTSVTCTEPLTNTPPGSPCACVWPMQVGLQLNVALYTFFPLVSELAEEIASGVFMKQSQVRIIGANAASQQLDKTIVLIDLVPLGDKFDAATALLTFERFWHKQVTIKSSFFGDYEVLYVRYPGLPPSPPSAPLSVSAIDGGPQFGQDNGARTIHPLGVDVRNKQKKGLGGSMIAVIVLSSSVFMGLCIGAAWLFLMKGADRNAAHNSCLPKPASQTSVPSSSKPTGGIGSKMFESGPSSASLSFGSSIAAYTGSAKTFTSGEMERATDNFDASRLIGEGGFGRVYRGVLDDGTTVAIKVLKRDDQQGGREFMAEVEMLSRLHHRNLVKLIGICIEAHARCLVYELIRNGSVESHLHGVDKETAPLDWSARMKIALGAARGLAYLHEDSSPRVIHRDFKASNILLEDDYTPKVSDFGLARTALDEESRHISTRVMGTFGYVAPEYAMTGHLLVKSDVYSYGVVLLELLTGRKPVDMSQPLGQENLVAWARPLLSSKEGLEIIIDQSLGSNFPFDCIAKVAAIASMCVQPEVSHRPFMGEVVQALKLVSEECDETRELGCESHSQEDVSVIDKNVKNAASPGHPAEVSVAHYPTLNYFTIDTQRALSASEIFNRSGGFGRQTSGSFRRHSSSGPVSSWRSRQIWDRVRGISRGSASEHGFAFKFWPSSH